MQTMKVEWIPIKEKLPEPDQLCYVTVEDTRGYWPQRLVMRGRHSHNNIWLSREWTPLFDKYHKALAWFPDPIEPYDGD